MHATPPQVNLQMSVRGITTCMFHNFFFEVGSNKANNCSNVVCVPLGGLRGRDLHTTRFICSFALIALGRAIAGLC